MLRRNTTHLPLWLAFLLFAGPVGCLGAELPFGPGERLVLRVTYAHLPAGRAMLEVLPGERDGRPVFRYVVEAQSQGFFAWLVHFKVQDRTVATWDPSTGCSLGIEKHLREGRASRDSDVEIDPVVGIASVRDVKVSDRRFDVDPCTLDVLSALFVTRARGVREGEILTLPVFDNGKRYSLSVRLVGRETLNLPSPFGKRVPTVIVEPTLLEESGAPAKREILRIWLTDDERRIPVRLRSKAPIGSVSADLESYEPFGVSPSQKTFSGASF